MADEIKETNWFTPDELSEDDLKEIGLAGGELARMQERIENPELGDPLLALLRPWPTKRKQGGASR